MDKIDRNYELVYIKDSGLDTEKSLSVKLPFTIEMNITRTNFSSSNIGNVRIYNLSKTQRNFMRKDWKNRSLRDRLVLSAGYGGNLTEILNMHVSKAFSIRQGVNFITQIDCIDGGYAYLNSKIEASYPAGTTKQSMIEDQASKLGDFGVSKGAIGNYPGTIKRQQSFVGNTLEALKETIAGDIFIDNSKVNILKKSEAIKGTPLKINAKAGLLSTPVRQDTYVEFEIIFEPQISIGRLIELESITGDSDVNQLYVVNYLSHRGTFSESVKGSVVTKVGCTPGDFLQIEAN